MTELTVESSAEAVVDLSEKKPIRVLHVDDELGLLKVAKQCLELQGPFQVDTAGSVEEALNKLKEKEYDAVISDYQMPGKDGLEFLEMLRKNGNTIPFIMFTGKGREEVAVKAWSLGADHYVNKTSDPETVYCELAHCLRSTVEKRFAETQMKETVRKLQSVFDASPNAIIIIDLHGKIVDCNKRAQEIFGYSSKSEFVGRNALEPIAEEDRQRAMENMEKVLKQGLMRSIEYTIIANDGSRRALSVSASVLRDVSGNPIGFVSATEDITERKKAEKEMESMVKFPAEDPEPVLRISSDGTLLYANQASQNMLKESQSKKDRTLIETLRRHAADALSSNEHLLFEEEHDGRIFQFNVVPVASEGYANLYARDITEPKQMEKQLKESEEKYRDLFENAMDAIITLDLKGDITAVNNSVLRFGYKKENLVGRNILDFVSREYWPAVTRDFSKVAQGVPAKNEVELIAPAGKILVEYNACAIVKQNNVAGVQINIRDATEHKKSEGLLKESEERFRDLFESIQDPVGIFVGREGRLIDYNAAFKRSSRYTDEELKGKAFLDFVHPDDRAMVLEKYQTEYSEEELPLVYEIRGLNKKGESLPLEISVSPYKKKGRAIGIEVIHRDITERKRYERSLSTLNTYSLRLNTARSMEEIYELTLDAAEKSLGFEFADVFMVKEKMLQLVTHRGKTKITSLSLLMDGDKGVSVRAARTGKPVLIADISKEEAYVEGEEGARSELAVPIKIGPRVLGVLNVESKELDSFDKKDQELLEILASHAATAISNLEYAKNLEMQTREIGESQEKFRRLFMHNPEAAVYVDSDFRVLDANPRFSELFGYSLNEIKDGHLLDLIVPENKKEEAEVLDKESKKAYTYCDTVRRRKDGTLVPVSISAAPITVGDQTVGYVGLYVDATERKRYEESLSALNTYSRDLNMAENRQEVYRLTLDAMQKVLGFEIAEFMMIDKNMLYIADKRGYPESFQYELPLDGSKKGITIKVAKTGNSIIVQDVRKNADFVEGLAGVLSELAVPIKVGQKTLGVLNVESKKLNAFDEKDQELLEILASHAVTAISGLDRARELEVYAREIRETKQKFEGLFLGNPEPTVYLAPDFHILDINQRFEELFGYSISEIKEKHIDEVVVPKDKMKEAEMLDGKAVEGYVYHDTFRMRKDGSLVPVSISAAPIKVEGKLVGTIGVYKDISDLKKIEKNLQEMNEKLQVVGQLTRHDVRNKLSTITGNAYLLKKQLASNSEILDKLRDMETAVQQVTKIFDFAKAYEMLGAEKLAYINVGKAVDEAVALFPDLKGVKIVNECNGLTVLADSLLRQLFYNMIDNSLKYGQEITKVRTRCEQTSQGELRLIYEDDGVGVPKTEKPKLFKQGYSTGGSTGYGLYLIRKMMEVYGWTIQETGTPCRGAQFTITIPKMNQNREENYRLQGA